MRILIADDDPLAQLSVQRTLSKLGHDCQAVADGQHAWEVYRADRPDVVISDWMMPGMSGTELCRRIRADSAGGYSYFIMVTSNGDTDKMLEGMTAGVDEYLVKPVAPGSLHGRLIAAARVTALHRQIALQQSHLNILNRELACLARRDALTDLSNRRALDEDLASLEARVVRYGHRYCLALLDVDLFKSYNDMYGHQAGDDVLRLVSAELVRQARNGDVLYRYGGEEILCILPEQSIESGMRAAERMRAAVEGLAIPHLGSPSGVITISAGLAVIEADVLQTSETVLAAADAALYRAKDLGRNRVECRSAASST